MSQMSPRMPPEAPRYELASLIMLILVYQNGFETETLRPKASNHMGGRRGCKPMSPSMPQSGSEVPPSTDVSTSWGEGPWVDEHDEKSGMQAPSCIGRLSPGGWRPRVDELDENQACKFMGASSGSSAASTSCPICALEASG